MKLLLSCFVFALMVVSVVLAYHTLSHIVQSYRTPQLEWYDFVGIVGTPFFFALWVWIEVHSSL